MARSTRSWQPCSQRRSRHRPPADDLKDRSIDEIEYEKIYRLEGEYWWYRALRDRIHALLDRYAPGFRSLLDAGCGTGGVLEDLRARHPSAHLVGLDSSAYALERCRTRGLDLLVRASINDLSLRSRSFDVVTSHDVLYFEGIDDERAVGELARVLAAGGVLVLNLPAFEFLRGAHDEFVKTRRRYTRSEVLKLVGGAGLEVLRATYWNAALFPAVALVRRLRRSRAQASESDLRPIPAWANRLLHGLLRLEAAWLRHRTLPFGTSVLCVARKPRDAAGARAHGR
jgi:ubiquinone/menaquinone biosynthesis C-methylase UbiE